MQRLKSGITNLDAAEATLIIVVVIGYVVGVVTGLTTAWDLNLILILPTLAMTAVYLALARGADQYFARHPSGWSAVFYFAIQLLLVTLTLLILGPGAWLISLPLAALAVDHLDRWWQRLLVYAAMMAGMALPFVREGRWQEALYFALTLSPAILFVVVFTRLARSEQQAREAAEALAGELEQANQQLTAYAAQVEDLARTRERNRLAREIHDSLGHYLTVVNVQIRAAQAIMAHDPEQAQAVLDKAQRLTKEGLDAVRQSVATLRESPLGDRSLPEALSDLLSEAECTETTTQMTLLGEPVALDPRLELALFRAAQEGLTNVCKHAQASLVNVSLDYRDDSAVTLTISDNGRGAALPGDGGYGLLGLGERVQLLGGQMQIDTSPGQGFTLAVTLPLPTPETEAAKEAAVLVGDL